MTFDTPALAVTAVFLAQIYVVSFDLPTRLRRAYVELFTQHPPAEYPQHYPLMTPERIQRLTGRRTFSYAIGCAGCVVLGVTLYAADHAWQLSRTMQLFLLVQMAPWTWTMVRFVRLRRAALALPPPRVRSADWQRLLLEDCLPRPAAFAAIALAVLAVGICIHALYLRTAERLSTIYLLLVNALLLWRMLQRVLRPLEFAQPYGYASPAMRDRDRRRLVQVVFAGGATFAALTLFLTVNRTSGFALRFEYVAIVLSSIIQAVSFLIARLVQNQVRKAIAEFRSESLPAS